MCVFLFLGVPATSGATPSIGSLTVRPAENTSVLAIFGARWAVYTLTDEGGCSCALHSDRRPSEIRAAERRRYAAKGWSRGKVDRAVEAKLSQGAVATFEEVSSWLAGLAQTLGEIALFAHAFGGATREEVVVSSGRRDWTVDDFVSEEGVIPLDVLVIVRDTNR
ncbi:MAG: hypothetical protein RL885_17210 [Planctomycetota bacterium]